MKTSKVQPGREDTPMAKSRDGCCNEGYFCVIDPIFGFTFVMLSNKKVQRHLVFMVEWARRHQLIHGWRLYQYYCIYLLT